MHPRATAAPPGALTVRVGIGLGSNVGNRLGALEAARSRVLEIPGVALPCLSSRLYETEPVDTAPGTESFLNAVIEVGFTGDPAALLRALQAVEVALGRPRVHGRNTPRTIDLDILYAGDLRVREPDLEIPHPRLAQRRFVLLPLHDIRPDLCLAGQQHTVAVLLRNLQDPAGARLSLTQWRSSPPAEGWPSSSSLGAD